jgi:replicative DNA helicase
MTTDPLPDYDPSPLAHLETEASVLAAIALDNGHMEPVRAVLDDRHWYSDTHRWIWRAMVTVLERDGAVSMVAVANELKAIDRLSQIGGTPELAALVWRAPYFVEVVANAEAIRDAYIARETVEALEDAAIAIRSRASGWREALNDMRERLRKVRE